MEIHIIVQEAVIRITPRKRNARRQSGCLRRLYKQLRKEVNSKRERERYTQLNVEFQRTARRDKKAFFSDQCKEIEESNRTEETRDLFKKIGDNKGIFHAKMGTTKDRNSKDLTEAEEIKKWQEHTELYQKVLNDLDNHDDVFTQRQTS